MQKISNIAAITALVITAITFYIEHTRNKTSEEIRVSREIWDRIDTLEAIVEKWTIEDQSERDDMGMIKARDSLINKLDYFVYLAKKGEIKDSTVREYYRKRLLISLGLPNL